MLTYRLNDRLNTLELEDFENFFNSTEEGCPVTSYRLVKFDSLGNVLDYTDEAIAMDQNFTVTIDTSATFNKILFIEASTANS